MRGVSCDENWEGGDAKECDLEDEDGDGEKPDDINEGVELSEPDMAKGAAFIDGSVAGENNRPMPLFEGVR